MGYDDARHLLNRSGFGATDAEIREYATLGRVQAVDRLLASAHREPSLRPPAFVDEPFVPFYKVRQMGAEERSAEQRKLMEQGFELLGNFGSLLRAVAKDPAMLIYLDNAGSRRQAPNENFAREVMELFTLGEGHYSEHDIKEAARAFTGWSLDRDSGEFTYRRMWHDYGEKTVLGRSGRLDGDDVIDILLGRRETAEFIAAKVWREFVSPHPDRTEVGRWAAAFRDSRYEIKPLLRAALTSNAFWAEENRASLIKSPVELVVGTMRTFDIHPFDLRPAVFACAALGQNPFSPPNVKGWPGGEAWITSATLLGRKQWLERVFRGSDSMAPENAMRETQAKGEGADRFRRMLERGMADYAFDAGRFARSMDSGDGAAGSLERLALATPPVSALGDERDLVERVRVLVADPAFQLK